MSNIKEALEELNKLEETKFQNKMQGMNHHYKHTAMNWEEYVNDEGDELLEPMSYEEYDSYADELSKIPVNTSNINSKDDVVGFVTTDDRIIKARKSLRDIVVYKCRLNDQTTLSYYQAKDVKDRYKRLLKYYKREITPEDDFYNK